MFDGVSALANRAAELDWKGSLVSALSSHVLRRPIRNQFAVLARRDGRGNQIEMVLHAVAIGFGHDQCGGLSLVWADRHKVELLNET